MKPENKAWFARGLRAGVPIGLGYFAVAFTLGIAARSAGLTAFQATLSSLLLNASAGEFVGFTLMSAGAGYLEVAIMEAVANARYLLMSFSLSQKLRPETGLIHRLILGWYVTDEVFGVSISAPGYLNPWYTYGAIALACPGWAAGTCLGVILGNIFPATVVSALSVGLYGMFIAIFIPPARKNKVLSHPKGLEGIKSTQCKMNRLALRLSSNPKVSDRAQVLQTLNRGSDSNAFRKESMYKLPLLSLLES